MIKNSVSDENKLNAALAAYTDALIDHKAMPDLDKKTSLEMADLVKTVDGFYASLKAIEPDEVVKRNILRKLQSEWDQNKYGKSPSKQTWFQVVARMIHQPVFRLVSIMITVLIIIVGIVLSLRPDSQTLLGTAESLKTGLMVGLIVLAALFLIWMLIRDKR